MTTLTDVAHKALMDVVGEVSAGFITPAAALADPLRRMRACKSRTRGAETFAAAVAALPTTCGTYTTPKYGGTFLMLRHPAIPTRLRVEEVVWRTRGIYTTGAYHSRPVLDLSEHALRRLVSRFLLEDGALPADWRPRLAAALRGMVLFALDVVHPSQDPPEPDESLVVDFADLRVVVEWTPDCPIVATLLRDDFTASGHRWVAMVDTGTQRMPSIPVGEPLPRASIKRGHTAALSSVVSEWIS